MNSRVRIAVTGLGTVSPLGVGVSTFWNRLLRNESAVSVTENPVLRSFAPVVAAANGFDPADWLTKKVINDTDRFTQLALVAAAEALADANYLAEGGTLHGVDGDDVGIAMGCALGGVQTLEAGSAKLAQNSSARLSPRLVSKSIPNAGAAAVAMKYGVRGSVLTYSTACASSANSIGEAAYWLERDEVKMVLAGGSECLFSPSIIAGLRSAGALAVEGPEDVSRWSRPFDVDRKGMVMGEGAAFLVMERLDHARARGAHIYAEFVGYGSSNDAYHETSPHPEGAGARLAMQRALRAAGLEPSDVDYVNAHATATAAGDRAESHALRAVFGAHLDHIPVSSIKGSVGHMLGTAGAIESLATVKSIETGWIPPTLNCENKDELAPPDVVQNSSRAQAIRTGLSNSFGFGGQNGVLIWRKED
jgi:3-oxoacyl-[acyl-carrier-protein] synthase II